MPPSRTAVAEIYGRFVNYTGQKYLSDMYSKITALVQQAVQCLPVGIITEKADWICACNTLHLRASLNLSLFCCSPKYLLSSAEPWLPGVFLVPPLLSFLFWYGASKDVHLLPGLVQSLWEEGILPRGRARTSLDGSRAAAKQSSTFHLHCEERMFSRTFLRWGDWATCGLLGNRPHAEAFAIQVPQPAVGCRNVLCQHMLAFTNQQIPQHTSLLRIHSDKLPPTKHSKQRSSGFAHDMRRTWLRYKVQIRYSCASARAPTRPPRLAIGAKSCSNR